MKHRKAVFSMRAGRQPLWMAIVLNAFFVAAMATPLYAQPVASAAATASVPSAPPSTSTSSKGQPPTATNVMSNIARAEATGNANDLVLAYGDAVRDPQLARGALTQLLTDYFRLRSLAGSAMQASQAVDEAALRFAIFQAAQSQVNVQQNQQLLAQQQKIAEQNEKLIEQNDVIIKQNDRMIALLGQIARQR